MCKSQVKPKKERGVCVMIAKKIGCHPDYVSRVLDGKVKTDRGKKARRIIELHTQINELFTN